MHEPALRRSRAGPLACVFTRRRGRRWLLDWLMVMPAPRVDAYQVDRAAWAWLLGRIWATHVVAGRAWLRVLCRPALVAFIALFALTLPTAHLHGPTGTERHIAVHWHGLPLLNAVLAARQHAAHQHVHTPGSPAVSAAPVRARAEPAPGSASEQRQTSPWHAMSAGSQSLTYLHSVLPLPQHMLAMLDFVWSVDAFWPPDVPLPPPETPPRVPLTTE